MISIAPAICDVRHCSDVREAQESVPDGRYRPGNALFGSLRHTMNLKNLSLGKKLAIIVIGMLLPSAWLFYVMVSSQQRTIASTELKLEGLNYMHRVWELSGALADHRGMGQQLTALSKSDGDAFRMAIVKRADGAAAAIDKLESSGDQRLRLGTDWQALTKEWRLLKDPNHGLDATKLYRAHTALIEKLDSFNVRISNTSTLRFEGDEATHFLVSAIVVEIPRVQNDLFALRRAVAVGAGEVGKVNSVRMELAMRAGVARSNAVSLKATVERLAKYQPEFASSLRSAFEAHAATVDTYTKTVDEGMILADKRADLLGRAASEATQAFKTSTELQNILVPQLKQELEARHNMATWTRNATVFAYFALLGIALLLERTLRRQIATNAQAVVTSMERMANGEIGHQLNIDSQDEFGRALAAVNKLDKKLAEVVNTIRTTADDVGKDASELSIGNEELSSRTQSQASALQQTASSMEQMTATVKQNADNARQANDLASGVRDQAEQGTEVVQRATNAMNEIKTSSTKIADIISVIDEIAFQTNLLALNAAVEAARAGEQGRGFAVVATEVRNLAQRSANAAKDIKSLINDSVQKVNAGSELVSSSGKTLADILENVRKVTDIVADIAAASSQQSAGIDQVNNAVAQMDAVTQENAARVDQASAASKSMQQQAERLVQQISYFRARHAESGTDRRAA